MTVPFVLIINKINKPETKLQALISVTELSNLVNIDKKYYSCYDNNEW
jgi:hypothetical protein